MPIVEVEIVLKTDETIPNKMVSELADQLGEIFGSPKNGTWVKVYGIAERLYAENGGKQEDVNPVFVSVLKASLPASEEIQSEIDAIVEAVAKICKRDSAFVHVIYWPAGKGRVAFGGKIVA
jgi:phenylpyruvate tautomerase PptA (4-oxalocrotonate tautomerase family)